MKILITDDEIEIRRVLRILLESHGHDVAEAKDRAEAVDVLSSDNSFDLCIMDIMMPEMSGIEATREIRRFSSVPILFLSAKSLPQDKIEAYSSGGDDYIVKPFPMAELLLKVEAMTRRYNLYSVKEAGMGELVRLQGGISVNVDEREVMKNGVRIEMRDKEIDVLIYLVKNRGRCILQHHNSKASILRCSALFTAQFSHPYVISGKNYSLNYKVRQGMGKQSGQH